MSSDNGNQARLDKKADWFIWNIAFQNQTSQLNLWTYIDPDIENPPAFKRQPMMTSMAKACANRPTTRTSLERHLLVLLFDLLPDERTTYSQAIEISKLSTKEYEKEERSIKAIQDWIMKSADPHTYAICCKAKENLRTWYANLKMIMKASPEETDRKARERYHAAIKELNGPPNQGWEAWIVRWEKAMDKTIYQGIAEAQSQRTWVADFIKHIASTNFGPKPSVTYPTVLPGIPLYCGAFHYITTGILTSQTNESAGTATSLR